MTAPTIRDCVRPSAAALAVAVLAGCQQKMAEQPYYRPYESTDVLPGQAVGPAARGRASSTAASRSTTTRSSPG